MEIVEALEEAYEDWKNGGQKLEEKGKNAREWAKKHTWNDKADQFIEFFDELEEKEKSTSGDGPIAVRKRENEIDETEFEVIFDHLKEYIGDSVLDVGCGSGRLMEFLDNKGFKVSGIDLSKYAVERAKKRDLNTFQGDMRELKSWFGENQYSCLIFQHSLEHIPKEERVEVLKDAIDIAQNKVFIICPSKAHLRYDESYPKDEIVTEEEIEEWEKAVNDMERDCF